jgi:hypothetical protein
MALEEGLQRQEKKRVRVSILVFKCYYISLSSIGGRTSARRNPTGTIPGNQAIKQEANAYINIKQ